MKTKKKIPLSEIKTKILTSDSIENIVEAIEDDHRDLKKFIAVMKDDDATYAEKKRATHSFMSLLKSHAPSEEKALYHRSLKVRALKLHAQEGFVEHKLADLLMKTISATSDKGRWTAQVKVLAEMVEHHIQEEEEDYLPLIKKHFVESKRLEMSREFLKLRQKSQRMITDRNAGALHSLQ